MLERSKEEKRSLLWRIAVTVSSILIILIAAFFIIKMFTANPIEGRWSYEDSDLIMTIKGNGIAVLEWPEEFGDADIAVEMSYTIDMDMKIFSLHMEEAAIEKAVEDSEGAVSEEELTSAVELWESAYDYNMEQNKLTLTDREYGDQMVFDKE